MFKSILTIFLLALCSSVTFAQLQVKGKVTDTEGLPIPGASIAVVDTNLGEISNANGEFTIEVPSENSSLKISFLGFQTKTIAVNNRTIINVVLEVQVTDLDEVVVVGYGSIRKSDISGSVVSVKVEDKVARQYNTVDQLLQGRAAGVQVSGGGQPGAGISVRIRGSNSLRGNNEPLYVVDGIIISSAGEDAQLGSSDGNALQVNQNGLNGINPRDIESVEILKDASATAIYGSRGANGVVLITTKAGESGEARINGFASTSLATVTRNIDVLGGVEYARYQNESALVNGENVPFQIVGNDVFNINYGVDGPNVSDVALQQLNWQNELLKTAQDYNAGLSISGGSDRGQYFVSAQYNDQGGLTDNSRFQTGNLRVNLKQQLSDKLELDTRINAYYGEGSFAQDGDRAGGANRSFINNMLLFSPLVTDDVDEFAADQGLSSPYSWINDFEDVSSETRLIGRVGLTYDLPVKGLKYEINAGGNIRTKKRSRWYGLTTFQGGSANGVLSLSQLEATSYQVNNLFKYNNRIGTDHRINAVLGFTIDGRNAINESYEVQNFSTTTFTVDQPFFGQTISLPLTVSASPTNILSTLGRFNYTFKDKYILTATFRYDGVSKFKNDNRWSLFPSFAAAWNAEQEDFIANLGVFDQLKIRAGWGQIGNHGIQPFQTLANYGGVLYGTPSNGTSVAFVPINIPNENLIWETTTQSNIGVDFGFLEGRLTGSLDVYQKRTTDLLQQLTLPASTGFNSLATNRGAIINRGIELGLSATILENENGMLNIGGNIAFNRNEIAELGLTESPIFMNGVEEQKSYYLGDNVSSGTFFKAPANIFMEGSPMGLFYGFETDGIYQSTDNIVVAGAQPGDVKIIDQNGDGVIDTNDRTIIGDPNPDFIFGMNIDASYKRFSLNVLLNGVYGNEIANGNMIRLATADATQTNITPASYHSAWRPDRESNLYPRIGYNGENNASAMTDRIVEDGSYLRLGNITLSYEIPKSPDSGWFSDMSVYVAGRNLLTLTKYSGFDPELSSFLYNGNILGVDWAGVPNTRSVTLGLNVTF